MDDAVRRIVERSCDLFGEKPRVERWNVGFTNTIFIVNEQYILKICFDPANEPDFIKEIEFYRQNGTEAFLPKLYRADASKRVVPYCYEIMEKIDGVSLYRVWHTFSEAERKAVIERLCKAMKRFHRVKGEPYDWASFITNRFKKLYQRAKSNYLFDAEEQSLIESTVRSFGGYLRSDDFVLVHNDLHFDNIFYSNGSVKLIDFERSMIAPRDFELDILYRMIRMPRKFASEEEEPLIHEKDYAHIMGYIDESYPELTSVPHLYERLSIYDMVYFLEQYAAHPEIGELKRPIIDAADMIAKSV